MMYLVIGAILKKFYLGLHGMDIIPNINFWTDLPYLVQVCQSWDKIATFILLFYTGWLLVHIWRLHSSLPANALGSRRST